VTLDRPAGPATFFPLEVSQVNDGAEQRVQTSGRELVMRLKKSDQLTADPRVLRGVLALPSGGAFVIEAPVAPAASRSSGKPPARN
jgi:hypothetical protein